MSEIICQTLNLSKKYTGSVALENININIKTDYKCDMKH